MLLTRRSILIAASLAAAPIPAWARGLSSGIFPHGVASGDPLPDGIILWARFVSPNGGRIAWEIADDEHFAHVAKRGEVSVSAADDYCVKADVRGLQPGRHYFYRFLSASGPSITGRTRTAPAGAADSLSIAFFSCSNLPFGYFHAYGHAALRDDVDVVMHLGDYMYEGRRGSYPSVDQTVPGRVLEPMNAEVTLADYYARYACYHRDTNLLEMRRLKPLTVVWDDHDFANNAWHDGAQAHYPDQGPWAARAAAASKAYFDWMPIRRPDPRGARIYRNLDWGNLARIVLIDTRYIGRTEQLDYAKDFLPAFSAPGADQRALAAQFMQRLSDPNRSVMGPAQEQWFAASLAESKRNGQPWQVVAQQIVLGQQKATPDVLRLLGSDATQNDRNWFTTAVQTSALDLPWNLDCWNGYPSAQARFIEACATNANNAVVLSGDSHNCWFNNIAAANSNRLAAIEFAGGSVTSPGFERELNNAQPGERERVLRSANSNLAWCDLTNRGYGAVKLTRTACEAEWLAFADVRSPQMPAPQVTRLSSAPSVSAGPGAWAVAT